MDPSGRFPCPEVQVPWAPLPPLSQLPLGAPPGAPPAFAYQAPPSAPHSGVRDRPPRRGEAVKAATAAAAGPAVPQGRQHCPLASQPPALELVAEAPPPRSVRRWRLARPRATHVGRPCENRGGRLPQANSLAAALPAAHQVRLGTEAALEVAVGRGQRGWR